MARGSAAAQAEKTQRAGDDIKLAAHQPVRPLGIHFIGSFEDAYAARFAGAADENEGAFGDGFGRALARSRTMHDGVLGARGTQRRISRAERVRTHLQRSETEVMKAPPDLGLETGLARRRENRCDA